MTSSAIPKARIQLDKMQAPKVLDSSISHQKVNNSPVATGLRKAVTTRKPYKGGMNLESESLRIKTSKK